MNKQLFKKSLNYRNEQAILKLANYDSRKVWATSNTSVDLPKYEPTPRVKLSVGLKNLCRELLV